MVRNGRQKISEGKYGLVCVQKTELKLIGVALASIEELLLVFR
ncbi:MAG: hypothetical protein ACUBOA_03380 [Candidatus Loosdrechtia sp.]|nr:MAG: hypothetical protein QY305_05665 [Candidatus Jettenia sp. AMX2]